MTWIIRKPPYWPVVLAVSTAWVSGLVFPPHSPGDTITVGALWAGVGVDPPIGADGDGWAIVENPCYHTLSAQVGNSASSGTIDFAWGEIFGTFLIQSGQVAVGATSGSTFTWMDGGIRLSVAQALPLHIDALWSYDLPADFMRTQFGVNIYSPDDGAVLFHQEYIQQTLPWEPMSGTFPIQGDVILTPGETWLIQYSFRLEADAGPSFSALGEGYLNLQISPECSTLAFLAPLLLVFPRRATRCSCQR